MNISVSLLLFITSVLVLRVTAKATFASGEGFNYEAQKEKEMISRKKRNNPLRFGLDIIRPKAVATEASSSSTNPKPLIMDKPSVITEGSTKAEQISNITVVIESKSLLDNVGRRLNPMEFAQKMRKLEVDVSTNTNEQETFRSQRGDDKVFHAPMKLKGKIESIQSFDPVEKTVKKVHYVDDEHEFYPLTGGQNTESTSVPTLDIHEPRPSLTGIVIGAIVCCVVIVFLIMVIMTCTCNRKKAKEYKKMLIEGAATDANIEKGGKSIPFESTEKLDKIDKFDDYGIITDRPLDLTKDPELYSVIEKAGIYETIKNNNQELVEIIRDLNKNLTNSLERKSEYNMSHHITSTI